MSEALKLKPGVLHGEDVKELFDFANRNDIAFPAVNVIGTDSVNAVLETRPKCKFAGDYSVF